VIPDYATEEQAMQVFLDGWRRSREASGGSYDDAGIGDFEQKMARLYGIPTERQQVFKDWFAEIYPGTSVKFTELP